MAREDKYLLGCLFAINRLQEKGSTYFAIKIDGELEKIPWNEISEWVGKKYAIRKAEMESEDGILDKGTQ